MVGVVVVVVVVVVVGACCRPGMYCIEPGVQEG